MMLLQFRPPFPEWNQIRFLTGCVLTWATKRIPYLDDDCLVLPEHMRSPHFFLLGSLCSIFSIFRFGFWFVWLNNEKIYAADFNTILFVWWSLFVSHGFCILFFTFEFECPFIIFRLCFITCHHIEQTMYWLCSDVVYLLFFKWGYGMIFN